MATTSIKDIEILISTIQACGADWTTLGELEAHIGKQPRPDVIEIAKEFDYISTEIIDSNWRNTKISVTSSGKSADIDSTVRQITELAAWGLY
ncbi:MAG: hypothetical protein ACR2QC_01330 [Gammaproteobacteria bacterium]